MPRTSKPWNRAVIGSAPGLTAITPSCIREESRIGIAATSDQFSLSMLTSAVSLANRRVIRIQAS